MDPVVVKTSLVQTLDASRAVRRAASDRLQSFHAHPEFLKLLLQIVQGSQVSRVGNVDINELNAQLAAAIYFKNYVKKGWNPDGAEYQKEYTVSQADREIIKTNIVELIALVDKKIMAQLSEAIRIIGETDFPDNWKNLLPNIKEKLVLQKHLPYPDQFRVINGMLETLNTLMKMFRDKEASDQLWLKLQYVLEEIQEHLLNFFIQLTDLMKEMFLGKEKMEVEVLKAIRLMCRIYYSVNWQTIPEFYEDHIQEYMTIFHECLELNDYSSQRFKALFASPEASETLLRIQAAIIINLQLYAEKYEEEFDPFLSQFTQDTWTLLTNCRDGEEFNEVVSAGLGFLGTIVAKSMNMELFSGPGILQSICEKVVLPNLMIKDYDIEIFETIPIDYIRGDLEGGDKISRRKTAIELLGNISKNFEADVTKITRNVINQVFKLDSKPDVAEPMKRINDDEELETLVKNYDVGITLFIAVAAKRYTFANGVTEVSDQMDVASFFAVVIAPILQLYQGQLNVAVDNSHLGILLADCLKFIVVFRKQLDIASLLPVLVQFLACKSFVVNSYSSVAFERILALKAEGSKENLITLEHIRPFLEPLLTNLFLIVEEGLSDESEYNEYAMKTVMRVVTVANQGIAPVRDVMIQKLAAILLKICPNPQNPTFNHYLFECVAAVISATIASTSSPNEVADSLAYFENNLFPLFQEILSQDVAELTPYVFQIMAQLLEANEETGREISAGYMSLFPALLAPAVWQNKGNNPVLVRLLSAYIRQNKLGNGHQIISASNVENLKGLLGVFQKLMAITSTEVYGLKLLTSIALFVDVALYIEFVPTMFQIILTKFQSKKSDIHAKRQFCVLYSVLISRLTLPKVQEMLENMFNGLFIQVTTQIFSGTIERMNEDNARKACLIGTSVIMTESPGFMRSEFAEPMLTAVLTMQAKGKTAENVVNVEEVLANLEETGYSSSFSKLVHSSEKPIDAFKDVADAEIFFAQKFGAFAKRQPGIVQPLFMKVISKHPLKGDIEPMVGRYFAKAGVSLT